MDSDLAPIALFVYKRADCTLKTLEHLKNNYLSDQSVLFIFSDGPKETDNKEEVLKIQEVRKIIRKEKWCKEVHIKESEVNMGLADSIINGVTEVLNDFNKIIVLEDDLLTSVHYLEYMNQGLFLYENFSQVFQIVGYTAPVRTSLSREAFFLPIASSLGWGTWKRAWVKFDFNPLDYQILKTDENIQYKFDLGNSFPYSKMLITQMEKGIDSWAVKMWWSVFKQGGVSLFPYKTLVAHIGFDIDATHTKNKVINFNKYWDLENIVEHYPKEIKISKRLYSKFKKYFRSTVKTSLLKKIKRKIVRILK